MSIDRPTLTSIPEGFVLTKKGGRPRKEARDAAIFLAKRWRMLQGDSATRAEHWIVEHWESLGQEASKGIGETAHVRSAAKRAEERGLIEAELGTVGVALMVAFEIGVHGGAWSDGVRCWLWGEGMPAAQEAIVKNLQASDGRTELSRSISQLFSHSR